MKIGTVSLFLIWMQLTTFAQEKEKVELKWNFKGNPSLRYEVQVRTEYADVKQEQLFGFVQKVIDVDAKGVATVGVTIDRFRYSTTSGETQVEYDSEIDGEKPTDPTAKLLSTFVGASYRMEISPQGEYLKFIGMKQMFEKMREGRDEQTQETLKSMEKNFTDESMKQLMGGGTQFLPLKEISVGESWKSSQTQQNPVLGALVAETKYTLQTIRNGGKEAVVHVEVKMKSDGKAGYALGKSGGTGEFVWDLTQGVMKSSKVSISMEIWAGEQKFDTKSTVEAKLTPKKKATQPSDR